MFNRVTVFALSTLLAGGLFGCKAEKQDGENPAIQPFADLTKDIPSKVSRTVTRTPAPVATEVPVDATFAPCEKAKTTLTNLEVCSASYLGSPAKDNGVAVEVSPNNTVVLVANIGAENNFGKNPINLSVENPSPVKGNGAIVITDITGKNIQTVTRLNAELMDADVDRNSGNIAVVGDFGLAVLDSKATQILWSKGIYKPTGANTRAIVRRVAIGKDGEIATSFNGIITVYDKNGDRLGQFTITGTYVYDIAIDSTTKSVIVTGFTQKDKGGCTKLQVAHIRSYDFNGTQKWKNYDWSHDQAHKGNSSCADTRGYRIAMGKDNMLYFAGESAGGNTIYRYNPRNLSVDAPNVSTDKYNKAYQTKSNHITYIARLNPSTGEIEKGQTILARLGNNNGNTIRPRAITADEKGNVYVGGVSAAYMDNRDKQTISGKPVSPYTGGDGFLLVVPPDFSSRKIWTTFTGDNTGGKGTSTEITGVSAYKGTAAIISTANGNMLTVNPVQGNNPGDTNAYFSVFPAY